MRYLSVLALALAVAGAAPAHAQPSAAQAPLTTHVGKPIAFRVDFPSDWDVGRQEEMVGARSERAFALVMFSDLMAEEDGESATLPISEAERRRIVTTAIMSSDSIIQAMMQEMVNGFQEDGSVMRDVVREVRTLAGQKSGYMSAAVEGLMDEVVRLEAHFTVRDGILYLLVTGSQKSVFAEHEPLFARIRDSLVLAPAPPAREKGSR